MSRYHTYDASLVLEYLQSQKNLTNAGIQVLRWFPAKNIRVCSPKTWRSPSLNPSTSLRLVCRWAHGIFYDPLWLIISSSLPEVFFMNSCYFSYAWCNLPISREYSTHSVVCRLFFWFSSSWAFETARGSSYILKAFTSLSWSVRSLFSTTFLWRYVILFAGRSYICKSYRIPVWNRERGVKAILSLCNRKAMVAWVGTARYCRKKPLLCSV